MMAGSTLALTLAMALAAADIVGAMGGRGGGGPKAACGSLLPRVHEFQTACCDQAGDDCDANGFPASCTIVCADTFVQFYADCGDKLLAISEDTESMRASFEVLVADCASDDSAGSDISKIFLSDHLEDCTNTAIGQPVTVSSTAYGGEPGRAVDGNTDSAYGGNSCTHTDNTELSWWQVDLGAFKSVRAVQVTNRADCCADRLDGARVIVSQQADYAAASASVCGEVEVEADGGDVEILSCGEADGAGGRYVTVEHKGIVSLCEVAVYTNCDGGLDPPAPPPPAVVEVAGCPRLVDCYTDLILDPVILDPVSIQLTNVMHAVSLARARPATASTTAYGGTPGRAVDGGLSAAFSDNSCTHTEAAGADGPAWWQVDLGAVVAVGSVELTNRGDCCDDRLVGAEVVLSAGPDFAAGASTGCGGVADPDVLVALECPPGSAGRYVTVVQRKGLLTLCEVEVFGGAGCAAAVGGAVGAPHALVDGCTSKASCGDLGWGGGGGGERVCGQSIFKTDANPQGCVTTEGQTDDGFAAALEVCEGVGARLCTAAELTAGEARGTGCGHDARRVYSSTPCAGGAVAVLGNGSGEPSCQTDLGAELGVRCCADAAPQPCDGGGALAMAHPTLQDGDFQLDSYPGVEVALGPGLHCDDPAGGDEPCDARAIIDGVIDPSAWGTSPNGDVGGCDEALYVTVDLGRRYSLTGVRLWHYYADARAYCGQRVSVSRSGAFGGEETVEWDTGSEFGPPESEAGNYVAFDEPVVARYVRHYCSGSTANMGVHFVEVEVFGADKNHKGGGGH
jgi:hypothetical protein